MPGAKTVPPRKTGRRRFLAAAGASGGAVLALRPGRPARAATTELRFLNIESDPESVAFLKALAQEYEARTGVRLVLETIVGTTLWTKVTTAIKTGKPYDIITFAQPTQTVLLAEEGQITPVTDIVRDIGIADFGPRALATFKGDVVSIPYNYNFCCLYYRKDWLDELKLPVPTDWAGFARVARAFTDPAKRRFGTSLPYSPGLTPWDNTGFLWAAGVKFYDDQWNVLIDTPDIKPRLARALDFLAMLNPCNAPGQFSMSLINITTNFLSGVAGIAPGSGRLVQDIENKAPELADKFVIAPYPAPDGGKGTVVHGGKTIAIGKTPNSQASLDFLRWFMTSGKVIDFQLTLPIVNQPAQYSTYENPRWLNNPQIRKNWPAVQTMRSFMDKNVVNVDAVQFQGNPMTVNQGLLLNAEVILRMYQNVLTQKMTPNDAIDSCAAEIRAFTRKDA